MYLMENNELNPAAQPKPSFIIPEKIPEAESIFFMGIISIAIGCLGIIPAIMALNKAPKAKMIYQANPRKYSSESYSQLKTGTVLAWVGLGLNILLFLFFIVYLFVVIGLGIADNF